MSGDTLLLASCGEDLRLWLLPELDLWAVKSSGNEKVLRCCCSPNGQLVAYAKAQEGITVTSLVDDLAAPVEIKTVGEQSSVSFSGNSRFIVGGGQDSVVNVWDTKSQTARKSFKDHVDPITFSIFNYNDSVVASASSKGDIMLTSIQSGVSEALGGSGPQAVRFLQYSYFSRNLLASIGDSGSLYLWDTKERKLLKQFTEHKAPGTSLSFSPLNDMLLCSCGLDRKLQFYDVVGKKIVKTIATEVPLTCCEFMSDGATVCVGALSGKIYMFDLRQGSTPTKVISGHLSSVKSVSFQRTPKESGQKSSKLGNTSDTKVTPASPSPSRPPVTVTTSVTPVLAPTHTGNNLMYRTELSRIDSIGDDVFSPIASDANADVKMALVRQKSGPSFRSDLHKSSSVAEDLDQIQSEFQRRPVYLKSKSSLTKFSLHKASAPEDVTKRGKDPELSESPDGKKGGLLNFISPFKKKQVYGKHSDESETSSVDSFSLDDQLKVGARGKGNRVSNRSNDSSVNSGGSTPSGVSRVLDPGQLITDIHNSLAAGIEPVLNGPLSQAATENAALAGHASRAALDVPSASPGPGAVLPVQFQTEFVQGMIEDALEENRMAIHSDMVNLQVEMLRQMEIQKEQIRQMLQAYSINDHLIAEIERLKEENMRLKTKY